MYKDRGSILLSVCVSRTTSPACTAGSVYTPLLLSAMHTRTVVDSTTASSLKEIVLIALVETYYTCRWRHSTNSLKAVVHVSYT